MSDDDAARFAAALPEVPTADATAFWAEASSARSGIALAPERFAAALEPGVALDELRAADLFLAVACCAGNAHALAAFEQLFKPIRDTLIRARYDAALVDDAVQTVRYRLLVATPEREAKLATYRGRGSLAGWLRVVVLRQARALLGARTDRSESRLADAFTEADTILSVLVRTHGAAIRQMFRDALASLDDRQRELLKLEILDGLPHQRIAELHDVHRTTVVRWIEEARQRLARDVRRRIKRELGISDESVDSLLRVLGGHIELSLGSGLVPRSAS